MKERPILFSAPMVRAILDGRKTAMYLVQQVVFPADSDMLNQAHRYVGKPGDRLWVQETWRTISRSEEITIGDATGGHKGCAVLIQYKAGDLPHQPDRFSNEPPRVGTDRCWKECPRNAYAGMPADASPTDGKDGMWRPSIHMPRWASRITLEIKNVRVERLQDISVSDVRAEGIEKGLLDTSYEMKEHFRELWDSINGKKPGASWKDNPWVWVIEFEKTAKDEIE